MRRGVLRCKWYKPVLVNLISSAFRPRFYVLPGGAYVKRVKGVRLLVLIKPCYSLSRVSQRRSTSRSRLIRIFIFDFSFSLYNPQHVLASLAYYF